MVTFDERKSTANLAIRGLSFERAEDFEWATAVIEYDRRRDYGEERFVALTAFSMTGYTPWYLLNALPIFV